MRSIPPSSPSRISRAASQPNWNCSRRLSIDQERLVSKSSPSSVPAISSASEPAAPGSRFTLVIRTIGWRAKPSARMQPPERSSPISAAVSREERKPASTPSRTIGTARPSTPSSSQRNEPSPPALVASALTLTCSEP